MGWTRAAFCQTCIRKQALREAKDVVGKLTECGQRPIQIAAMPPNLVLFRCGSAATGLPHISLCLSLSVSTPPSQLSCLTVSCRSLSPQFRSSYHSLSSSCVGDKAAVGTSPTVVSNQGCPRLVLVPWKRTRPPNGSHPLGRLMPNVAWAG